MDIYIQSRGVSQGYHWLKITKEVQEPIEPPIPAQVSELIDSDAFSLVLAQFNDKLILLVTGLEASQRTDNRTRKIRNSVAWIGQKSDEPIFRSLAAQALHDDFKVIVDRAVKSVDKDGFEVVYDDLPQLTPTGINGNSHPEETKKIGNSLKLKKQLADELTKYRLPERSEIIVLVSDVNTRQNFENTRVWRGLSSQIDSDRWEALKAENLNQEGLPNVINNGRPGLINGLFQIVLITILVGSLAGNGWLYQQWVGAQTQVNNLETQVQSLQNRKQVLETKLQDLNIKKQSLEMQLKKLETQLQNKQNQRANLQSIVEDLKNQKRDLDKQVQDLENQVQALENREQALENQVIISQSQTAN